MTIRRNTAKQESRWVKKGERIGGNIATIASKVKNIIADLNVEHKFVYGTDNQNPNGSGVMTPLLGITQGVDVGQRTGDSIKLTSFSFREHITMNTTAVTSMVRSIWFLDNQTVAGQYPTVSQVLNAANPLAPYNPLYKGRFHILSDKTYELNTYKSIGVYHKHSMKLNRHVKFTGSGSTTADVLKHQLYHICIGDQGTYVPTFLAMWKVNYVDN